jgi:predicted metal-dependent phosphoesterase TrpH
VLIDLHTHTRRHSWDSLLSPDQLIELAKKAGLDGICLTEHDLFWDHDEVRELARKHDFLVLPGVEINTDDGHMVCFGLEGYIFGMHRVSELASQVARCGGVMIGAHPYRRQMSPRPEHDAEYALKLAAACQNPAYSHCAAIERWNGRGNAIENDFSRRVLEGTGLGAVAGSDSHSPADVGRCATEFRDDVTGLDDLIAALRAGRCRPVWLNGDGPK